MNNNKHISKAFSLVELSIVILIIGVLTAAVGQGIELLQDSRIKAAQVITKGSRVASVKGLLFWYETSLDESFQENENEDGVNITQWNDINPQSVSKLNAYAGQKTDTTKVTYNINSGATSSNTSGPTYIYNGINNIPTLRFANSGTSVYQYLVVDPAMKNNPVGSMTLFLVMKHYSGQGYVLDRSCPSASTGGSIECTSSPSEGDPLFGLRTQTSGTLRAYVRADVGVDGFTGFSDYWNTGFSLEPERGYIITLRRDYNNNFTVYVNGATSDSSSQSDNGLSITLDPIKIACHASADGFNVNMDASEFIFFSDYVSTKHQRQIEDYLSKKYRIAVTHN